MDKYAFQLSALFKTESARSRKQRRTLKKIREDLKSWAPKDLALEKLMGEDYAACL